MGNQKISDFERRIREEAISNLERRLRFGERIVNRSEEDGLRPYPGQILRVYEAVENGTRRILFADATGFGKTYTVSMIHGLLNQRKGKRHKTLVVAPQQAIQTAWTENEINEYIESLGIKGKPLKVTQLENDNLEGILRGNDIICSTYSKFNCNTSDKYVDALLQMAAKVDMIVFDESHNNKSFGKRGKNIERLIKKTKNKRVILLSATPGQNGLADLGVPLHILNPDNPQRFPLAPYEYNADPTAIKDMILEGKWFNSDRETVKALHNLPQLTVNEPEYCDIGPKHARQYFNVWRNGDLGVGSKIHLLRKYLYKAK